MRGIVGLWLCLCLASPLLSADNGFVDIFNGKDLTGWAGNPELWSVQDGLLTGQTRGPDHLKYNQFLIWKGVDGKNTVRNFELKAVFRLEGDNNSGVQYRSREMPDQGDFVVGGYQADIHGNPPYTGMLYDERGRGILAERGQKVVVQKDGQKQVSSLEGHFDKVDLSQWTELVIVANGPRVTHSINGQVGVDITDLQESERELEGILALQVHAGPAMKVQFKSIQLKMLPETVTAAKRRVKPLQAAQMAPAKWLWIKEGEKLASTVYLRKEFEQTSSIQSARLFGAVDNGMIVWIDGEKVLSHEGWGEAGSSDVSKYFAKPGSHVIAIEAKNSGVDNPAGVLANLVFESRGQVSGNITTDASWQSSTQLGEGWQKAGFHAAGWKSPDVIANLEGGPWKLTTAKLLEAGSAKTANSTPIDALKIAKDFRVELLYTVPKEIEGSWVNMCVDPKGRLIVSDQYGGLYRVTPPALEKTKAVTTTGVVVSQQEDAVRVTDITLGSPAETSGQVFVGDVVLAVEEAGRVVKAHAHAAAAINALLTGDLAGDVTLTLAGTENEAPVQVTLPRQPMIVNSDKVAIEKIPAKIGEAQGLLWAFDALYVVVNRGQEFESGLYRVTDQDGDDQLETVELLRLLPGSAGEHGPHAVLLTPDQQDLYVVVGNQAKLTEISGSRVPQIWDEDKLLPRIYGRGFMRGVAPPAGIIYKVDRDGKKWEVIASGFRNQFDAAVNRAGDLFTYDADMEWDMNCPWYRPTRICHVVSGTDWGWRNGSAKWPIYFPETLTPVVDIGPGSPTGITFGYGAKFPAKYQNALFINDWSYGKMYAVHMDRAGSTYTGSIEEFVTGVPLPLTDTVIHPDGSMYFAIGGRKVQSGLYRVTYAGPESTQPVAVKENIPQEVAQRHQLEAFHGQRNPQAIDVAWEHLGHPDRFVRAAARTVLEHQPVEQWQDRALQEGNPRKSLAALLALARMHKRTYVPMGPDLDTPAPDYPVQAGSQHPIENQILEAIARIDWHALPLDEQIELVRVVHVTLYRLGAPDENVRPAIIAAVDQVYPAKDKDLNSLLTELMVYLQAPSAAAKGTALLAAAPTQEEQIDQARHLRFLKVGWTRETRRVYLDWFNKARAFRGGANFADFMNEMRADALKNTPEEEQHALAEVINAPVPEVVSPASATPRPFVKEWKMEEAATLLATGLTGRDFDRGKALFSAANCYGCHRFSHEGGSVGPDLTALSGRFSPRDILESVLEPSKVVSDQYAAVQIVTNEGKVVVGRIVNLSGDNYLVNTNMLDPNAMETIDRQSIEEMGPAKSSMMPNGLLNTLSDDELLDLMAFLLSRGDRGNAMFKQQ